jgi:hypothetical protein
MKPHVPVSTTCSSPGLLLNSLRAANPVMGGRFQPGPPPPSPFSSHNPFLLPYLRRYVTHG